MASILIHTADESVTLTAQAVKRLLERGDGDAALLYLALLRRHGTVQPRALAGELRWDRSRIEAAEETLRQLGLIAPAELPAPLAPAEEHPPYPRADILERVRQWFTDHENLDVGALKEILGLSRKYLIALLEYMDNERITVRVGDQRRYRGR